MRRRSVIRLLAAFLAMVGVAADVDVASAGAVQDCGVPGFGRDSLLALRAQRFEVPDGRRGELAVALLPCLGARDPILRDEVAFTALSTWMRRKLLTPDVLRTLAARALAMLDAPPDSLGFSQSFAALTLSEIVRADGLDSALAPGTLAGIGDAAARHMVGIRDYRGYDARDGWRHDIAHSADLILQLGLHPRVDVAPLERLMRALGTQVGAHDGAVYLESEPERMARTVALIYGRDRLPMTFWDNWLRQITDPRPFEHWGAALLSVDGRARRANTIAFLFTLDLAVRRTSPASHAALSALVDRELRRLIAI